MSDNKILFISHGVKLWEIQSQIKRHQKPDGTQIILGPENQERVKYIVKLLDAVIKEINEIK